MNSFPNVSPEKNCFCDGLPLGKQTGKSRQTSATRAEKFQVRTHEQIVALASQLALWPGANSQNQKVSGGRDRRRTRTIDATEIKKMKADGMGPSSIAKALKICRASVYRALRN